MRKGKGTGTLQWTLVTRGSPGKGPQKRVSRDEGSVYYFVLSEREWGRVGGSGGSGLSAEK